MQIQHKAQLSSFLLAATTFMVGTAEANPWSFEADTSLSTSVIDRGETLALFNNETNLSIARETPFGEVYGALYRISPLGNDAKAVNEELDYTIGIAFDAGDISADLSVNLLTFPGSSDDSTVELAGGLAFNAPLNPELALFYDVDLDVYGVETSIAPSLELSTMSLGITGIVRVGAVASDQDSYNYAGLEGILERQLGDRASVQAFVRYEIADQDNFISDFRDGDVAGLSSDGSSVGLRLIVHELM